MQLPVFLENMASMKPKEQNINVRSIILSMITDSICYHKLTILWTDLIFG